MGCIGFKLGLSAEMVKMAGAVGAFFVSYRFYQELSNGLASWSFLSIEWAAALMMAILVVLGYLAITQLLRRLEKVMQVTFQAKLNKLGGLVAGVARGALVASVILVICSQLPSPYLNASIMERSFSGSLVSRTAPALYDALVPMCGRFYRTLSAKS